MSIIHRLYRQLAPKVPTRLKIFLRIIVEKFFDIGGVRYFSQFGEDAFLQGYFEAKAYHRDASKAFPFRRPRLMPGYYIDIGAFAPKQHSNTYLFYKQGWRGINVDATPGSMKAFNIIRSKDINIEIGVSNQEKEIIFYCWGVPAVINTLSPQHARRWAEKIGRAPDKVVVNATRLDTILDTYLPDNQKIDFLSLDVEGHDLEVLTSNDWSKYRPELIVVEYEADSLQQLMASDIAEYLKTVRYTQIAWIPPSLIFKDQDQ